MCGIAGIYSTSPDDLSPAVVESMIGEMVHRGPDSHGLEMAGSVVFGHRRLKILDLSGNRLGPVHGRAVVEPRDCRIE